MKLAHCFKNYSSSYIGVSFDVWVDDDAKVGDQVEIKSCGFSGWVTVTGFKDTSKTSVNVEARELAIGDVIYYDKEWRTVLNVYCHPRSCYQKLNVSQSNSPYPLHVKLDKSGLVTRLTEKQIMSLSLINSNEMVKVIQAKLIDYQALNDAPDRVEIVPTVFVDKAPIMSALKAEIKAEYSKLGEQLKKL